MLPEMGGARPKASPTSPTPIKNTTTLPLGPDVLRDLDALAAHVDGAVVVVVEVNGARYRRRCYLTAAAAETAARKATDRGENAVVYLAELKPLLGLIGGEDR